jgi:membrane fusion protein, copper/silver efflux system
MNRLIVLFLTIILAGCGVDSPHQHQAHEDQPEQHDHAHHQTEHLDHDHSHAVQVEPSLADRAMGKTSTEIWTCPMHPQIVRDQPGQCPICGMALVSRDRSERDSVVVRLPAAVQQQMNVRTARVERGRLFRRMNALGRIQVDEASLNHLHPRVQGWVSNLQVRSAGDTVREGERLYTLYSPELVSIQEEFLQALRTGQNDRIRATRQRLAVLDVQADVIARIERERQVLTQVPWYARRDGYVAELNVRDGMFVAPGTEMMVIADPTSVWLIAEVDGGQIDWLAEEQVVEIERTTRPGQRLRGRVSFIYPQLQPVTRTARARIVLDNPDGELRAGDWARVAIFGGPKENVLFVPTEAIIRTGTQVRVVIQNDDETFSVGEVHAGLESGPYTEILHGLEEDQIIVTSGQFLIDSEAAMRAGHERIGGQHDH